MDTFAGAGDPVALRRKLGDRFAHQFRALDTGAGLLETKRFLGRPPEEEAAFERIKTNLATHPNPFLGPVQETAAEASFDDLDPPPVFLVSLDAPAGALATNARNFFGEGGAANPTGLGQRARRRSWRERSGKRAAPRTPLHSETRRAAHAVLPLWLPPEGRRARSPARGSTGPMPRECGPIPASSGNATPSPSTRRRSLGSPAKPPGTTTTSAAASPTTTTFKSTSSTRPASTST